MGAKEDCVDSGVGIGKLEPAYANVTFQVLTRGTRRLPWGILPSLTRCLPLGAGGR